MTGYKVVVLVVGVGVIKARKAVLVQGDLRTQTHSGTELCVIPVNIIVGIVSPVPLRVKTGIHTACAKVEQSAIIKQVATPER